MLTYLCCSVWSVVALLDCCKAISVSLDGPINRDWILGFPLMSLKQNFQKIFR
uniref:Hypothetical secreted peptide n=1 Tax=Glossina morsitans morsitans TaxID=37546 RepID=D3TSP9_GLOMM